MSKRDHENSDNVSYTALKATSGSDEDVGDLAPSFTGWQHFETKGLLVIQKAKPWMTPLALLVHYLVSLEVISPVLAALVWMTSLPEAASAISCICVGQALNTMIKWSCQRPRPLWLLRAEFGVVNMEGAWQGDFSFPSSHTQFFASFVFCSAAVYGLPTDWYWALVLIVILSGLTRNYLGLHWCSDTLAAGLLGALIGFLWGAHDPISRIMHVKSMWLSMAVATGIIALLCAGLHVSRSLSRPVNEQILAAWHKNAIDSLPLKLAIEDKQEKYSFKGRAFESIAPELSTAWCGIASSGFWLKLLPKAALEACHWGDTPVLTLVLRLVLGLAGLVVLALPLIVLRKKCTRASIKLLLKAATFVGLCGWVFLFSHFVLCLVGLSCAGA